MEKWIFGLSDEKQRLEALCARIGIPSNTPEHMKWEMVGRRLASEQPEFREKRGRGRPSVGRFGLDYQRATEIKKRRREQVAAGESRRITDLSLIKELAESDHKLFPQATDIDVLAQSVSRGNKVWAEESAKAQKSLKQIMARERAEKRREARREAKMRKQAREWAAARKEKLAAARTGGIWGASLLDFPNGIPDPKQTCDQFLFFPITTNPISWP